MTKHFNGSLDKHSEAGFLSKVSPAFYSIILTWPAAQRSALMAGLMASEAFVYLLWVLFVLFNPNVTQYVNMPLLNVLMPLSVLPIIIFLLFLWVFLSLPKDSTQQPYIEFLLMLVYSAYVMYLGYLIGFETILTGTSLMGGTALCLTLVHRLTSYITLVLNFCAIFIVLTLTAQDVVLHTPLYAQEYAVLPLFWVVSFVYFLAIKIIMIFVTIDIVITSLKGSHKKIRYLSEHDALTGLLNRHSMHLYLDEILEKGSGLSLVLLDIDNFKLINDTHGHLVGDKVLVSVAQTLAVCVRKGDLVCRFGGEEFLVILPNTDTEPARVLAERMREAVAERLVVVDDDKVLSVQASFGVAYASAKQVNESRLKPSAIAHDLIELADEAMYAAKRKGKNRVIVSPPPT